METKKSEKTNSSDTPKDVKTSRHAIRYIIVGILVTGFNYDLFTILSNLIIKNIDLNWLSTLISDIITIIVAFIAHSKITWKELPVTKHTIIRFFIWNAILAIAIQPTLVQIFSFLTALYDFIYNITSAIHLPFSYNFVLNTGAFALASLVIIILNFLFYDKFVFSKKEATNEK